MEAKVDLFLETVRLSKYRDKFRSDGVCPVLDVSEFKRFLSDQDALKQQVGMSNLEVKRFIRLCDSTIQVTPLIPMPIIYIYHDTHLGNDTALFCSSYYWSPSCRT